MNQRDGEEEREEEEDMAEILQPGTAAQRSEEPVHSLLQTCHILTAISLPSINTQPLNSSSLLTCSNPKE